MSTRSALSSADSGSSSSSTAGLVTMARARATRCWLAARKLVRLAVAELAEPNKFERLTHPPPFLFGTAFAHAQPEPNVVGHAHVGKQGVVLEHHSDFTLFDRNVFNRLLADPYGAAVGEDEARDGSQQGGLPAAGRSQKPKEPAVGKVHGHVVEGFQRSERLGYVPDGNLGHQRSPPKFEKRAATSMKSMETVMMMVEIAFISGVNPLRIDV